MGKLKYKIIKTKETKGLADDAKRHRCTQWEELKERRFETKERAAYWKRREEEQSSLIRAEYEYARAHSKITYPDYTITSKPKKEQK